MAIDKGDDAHTRAFVEQHFDEPFLKNFSMDEHLGVFRDLHATLPVLEVSQIQKTGPYTVSFVLISGQTGKKVKGHFDLEAQPPHRFVGLGFEPME